MRGQEDGFAKLRKVLDDLPEMPPGVRIETSSRLIKEQDFRVAGQSNPDIKPAFLPSGELVDLRLPLLLEPYECDHLIQRSRMRIKAPVHVDRLGDGQVGVYTRRLQDDPHLFPEPAGMGRGIDAKHRDSSGIAGAESLQDLNGRGLARAVRPEQGKDFSLRDGKVNALDRYQAGVRLAQALNFDNAARHDRSYRTRNWSRLSCDGANDSPFPTARSQGDDVEGLKQRTVSSPPLSRARPLPC